MPKFLLIPVLHFSPSPHPLTGAPPPAAVIRDARGYSFYPGKTNSDGDGAAVAVAVVQQHCDGC